MPCRWPSASVAPEVLSIIPTRAASIPQWPLANAVGLPGCDLRWAPSEIAEFTLSEGEGTMPSARASSPTPLAVAQKVTKGRKMRTDGTVVETNIHVPSDRRQLADSVRVLAGTVMRAKTVLQAGRQKVCQQFQEFTQAACQTARQIGETLSQRSEAAREVGKQKYRELLEMTEKMVAWAVQTEAQLKGQAQQQFHARS